MIPITDRIKDLKKQKGISINNFLGRNHVDAVEKAFKKYTDLGIVPIDWCNRYGIIYFSKNSERGIILAFQYQESVRLYGFRYAVLGSDSKVLSDP